MKFEKTLTDQAVLTEVGRRLARRRLDLELSQADLADCTGLSKRTVERLEAGESAQFVSFIRVLRALDLLEGLDQLLPAPGPRPLDLLKLQGKQRQRAPSSRQQAAPEAANETGTEDDAWRWGEDE